MSKKILTTKQKIKRYRAVQYGTFAGEYAAIAAPYAVLGAINWDKWFISNPEGWKVGLGGSIAIVLVSIATLLVTKSKEDKNLTSGYVALIIGWLMAGFVFKLLGQIMLEIADIMFITSSGLMAAFGLDLGSKQAKKEKLKAIEAKVEAEKELDKEQARAEIEEQRKIRVRIK